MKLCIVQISYGYITPGDWANPPNEFDIGILLVLIAKQNQEAPQPVFFFGGI